MFAYTSFFRNYLRKGCVFHPLEKIFWETKNAIKTRRHGFGDGSNVIPAITSSPKQLSRSVDAFTCDSLLLTQIRFRIDTPSRETDAGGVWQWVRPKRIEISDGHREG